ncbi:MAG: HD domain-containing protein [Desulfovibrio sp.]|jgi:HD superfamily phosphohydrolase|nr:HD domain-containing protein [Desulfovibrio sp.]
MKYCDVLTCVSNDVLPALLPISEEDSGKGGGEARLRNKIIHDHLWGSSSYYPWEIALLDTPLMQRLRQIHQLGTASFTYPSAVHNRFSHSLGVALLAGQLVTTLRDKLRDGSVDPKGEDVDSVVSQKDVYSVRIAGLLHDIGHCFFSHCSERVVGKILGVIFDDELSDVIPQEPKAHELIAYIVLHTEHFANFWDSQIVPLFPDKTCVPDPRDIACMIVGKAVSSRKRFLTEIINGHYDVDKMEYLHRDAKTAGLAITYDRDRFFQKITLYREEVAGDVCWRLVMDIQGIQAVEQMIISKMMLSPYVYHHHKVLTADALVFDIVSMLSAGAEHSAINARNYFDLLKYTDSDLLGFGGNSPNVNLNNMLDRLRRRKLLMRCFVLHHDFLIEAENVQVALSEFRKDVKLDLDNMRRGIVATMKSLYEECADLSIYDVTITETKEHNLLQSMGKAVVLTHERKIDRLENHWLMNNWEATYGAKKNRVYVHVPRKFIRQGFNAVCSFLEKKYQLRVDRKRVCEYAKVPLNTGEDSLLACFTA